LQKTFQKIWKGQKVAYICTRNGQIADRVTEEDREVAGNKKFFKKSFAKIWWFKKNTSSLQSGSEKSGAVLKRKLR